MSGSPPPPRGLTALLGGGSLAAPGSVSPAAPATAAKRMEELLRAAEREILEETNRARDRAEGRGESSSSTRPSTTSRFLGRARKAVKKLLGIPTKRRPSFSTHHEQAVEEPTLSAYAAVMRSALANIQDGAAAGEKWVAALSEMEKAMTGLMDLSYTKVDPTGVPREFATKWPHDDAELLDERVMDDPVILASGYSVDQSYHRWFCVQKDTCPVTNHSLPHSLAIPDHLLRDMIAVWYFDHSNIPRSTTADTLSIPLAPSEEQIQDILRKFSGNSELQKEALHMIYLISKSSKGVQPCLHKWSDLVPMLIELKKKWKSTWSNNLEEERVSSILYLCTHRPNREILAEQKKLPASLKKVIEKANKLGSSASCLAKVASTVAILSEFDVFRKRMLDIGGMEMLRDLLKIKDVVVRQETGAAIFALCSTCIEGNSRAAVCNVLDVVVECFTATDEFLLLFGILPKPPHLVDKLGDLYVELVDIVMEEHPGGMVTSKGVYSAISMIYIIVQSKERKMKVKNVEGFKERLEELLSKGMPMRFVFQVEEIIKILSGMFPDPTRTEQNPQSSGSSPH